MHPQVIIPRREPVWRPGFDEETYEKSRIIVPERYRRAPQRAAIVLSAHTIAQSSINDVTTSAIDTSGASLLVVGASFYTLVADPTITDSKSNTWVPLTKHAGASGDGSSQLFYAANPTVGSGHTFTATGTGSAPCIGVLAFSGVATASPFDQENGAAWTSGTYTSIATGNITTSVDTVFVTHLQPSSATGGIAIDSSFVLDDSAIIIGGTAFGGAMAHKIEGAASENPTWSWTTVSAGVNSIATFKAATGGGGTPLFRASLLNGLGSGGPSFNNPLG